MLVLSIETSLSPLHLRFAEKEAGQPCAERRRPPRSGEPLGKRIEKEAERADASGCPRPLGTQEKEAPEEYGRFETGQIEMGQHDARTAA